MRSETALDPNPAETDEDGRQQPDVVSLTMPNEARFASAARTLVGGLAARLNCSYESLDDLQLAVEAVISEGTDSCREITVEVAIGESGLEILMGPVRRDILRERGASTHGGIPLPVLLARVVDEREVVDYCGARWLRIGKRLAPTAAE